MYDPTTAQWTTEDPIEFDAEDPNLRRYVGNDPTNSTDPSGLQSRSDLQVLKDAKPGDFPSLQGPPSLAIGGVYQAKLNFEGEFTESEKKQLRAATAGAALLIHRALYVLENNDLWTALQNQGTKGYVYPQQGGVPLEYPTKIATDKAITLLNKTRQYWIARLKEAYRGVINPNSVISFYKTDRSISATGSELVTDFNGIPNTRFGMNIMRIHVFPNYFGTKGVPTPAGHQAERMAHELGRYFVQLPDEPKGVVGYALGSTIDDSPILQWDTIIDYINKNYYKIVRPTMKAAK
jgi:hypothetical protein